MAYTLSSVAAVVADRYLDDDALLVSRQLRHWTVLGLLKTEAGVFLGPGNHRSYSDDTVYFAALLVRIAAMGLAAGPLRAVADGLGRLFTKYPEARVLWQKAIDGAEPVVDFWLTFIRSPGTNILVEATVVLAPHGVDDPDLPHSAVPAIRINLTDLFRRVNARITAR
jgi:hypothetical protein